MLTQTLALFIDSYRELQAKKIFLISMGVSALIVLALAVVGMTEDGNLSLLWFETSLPVGSFITSPGGLHKALFMALGLNIWLAWGATILAIASTAGVFPDFLEGGAIDLALSKPINRTRLFFTKYLASMIFVGLQVTLFTVLSFFVIGLRGGAWEPAIFLAIPLVTIFYSYLYSICALIGILTRSAVTSLILTMAAWMLIFMIHGAEQGMLFWHTGNEVRVHNYETRLASLTAAAELRADEPADVSQLDNAKRYFADGATSIALEKTTASLDQARRDTESSARFHGIAYAVKSVLPKTSETIGILERWLIEQADMEKLAAAGDNQSVQIETRDESEEMTLEMRRAQQNLTSLEVETKLRSRPVWWIIGTSLVFSGAQ